MRNPVARKRFEEVLDIEEGEGVNQMWEKIRDSLLKATEVCGWTIGHARHIQTWWWNEEVRTVIEMKKVKFREWQKAKASTEEEVKLKVYVEAKEAAAKAQQKERERFGERLDTKEGQRSVYRIAKQMASEKKDIIDMKCLKNEW